MNNVNNPWHQLCTEFFCRPKVNVNVIHALFFLHDYFFLNGLGIPLGRIRLFEFLPDDSGNYIQAFSEKYHNLFLSGLKFFYGLKIGGDNECSEYIEREKKDSMIFPPSILFGIICF